MDTDEPTTVRIERAVSNIQTRRDNRWYDGLIKWAIAVATSIMMTMIGSMLLIWKDNDINKIEIAKAEEQIKELRGRIDDLQKDLSEYNLLKLRIENIEKQRPQNR